MPELLGSEPFARTKTAQAVLSLPPLDRPNSLTIRFSRASDVENFIDLYSGPRKYRIDPKGFVRKRSPEEIIEAVKRGAAVLALDENGEIRASALAQRHDKSDGHSNGNNFTEIGAVMCDVGGIGLPKLVVGMLSLKQHFDPKANAAVFAKVADDNDASNHLFEKSMQWNVVECQEKRKQLFDVAYNGKEGNRTRIWYEFGEASSDKAYESIKQAVIDEELRSKDGRHVSINVAQSSLWSTLQFHEMLAGREIEA